MRLYQIVYKLSGHDRLFPFVNLRQFLIFCSITIMIAPISKAFDGAAGSGYSGPTDTLSIRAIMNGNFVLRTRNEHCYWIDPNATFSFNSLAELRWVLVREGDYFKLIDCQDCCVSLDTIQHVFSVLPEHEFDIWVNANSDKATLTFIGGIRSAIIFPKPFVFAQSAVSRLDEHDSRINKADSVLESLTGEVDIVSRILSTLQDLLHWILYGGLILYLVDWFRNRRRKVKSDALAKSNKNDAGS